MKNYVSGVSVYDQVLTGGNSRPVVQGADPKAFARLINDLMRGITKEIAQTGGTFTWEGRTYDISTPAGSFMLGQITNDLNTSLTGIMDLVKAEMTMEDSVSKLI